MITVLKMLLHWCELVTKILVRYKDVSPQDRVDLRIVLREFEGAIHSLEKDSRDNIR